MEQPPAPGKSQNENPELTVNERSVDDTDYEKKVQNDFYKKSRKIFLSKLLLKLNWSEIQERFREERAGAQNSSVSNGRRSIK